MDLTLTLVLFVNQDLHFKEPFVLASVQLETLILTVVKLAHYLIVNNALLISKFAKFAMPVSN